MAYDQSIKLSSGSAAGKPQAMGGGGRLKPVTDLRTAYGPDRQSATGPIQGDLARPPNRATPGVQPHGVNDGDHF